MLRYAFYMLNSTKRDHWRQQHIQNCIQQIANEENCIANWLKRNACNTQRYLLYVSAIALRGPRTFENDGHKGEHQKEDHNENANEM